jgi:16S rRNA (adenine1518-N6/adenine1519-N6)-dimethyltransferase
MRWNWIGTALLLPPPNRNSAVADFDPALSAEVGNSRLRVGEGRGGGSIAPYLDAGPARIVANLPYNIATALLVRWLDVEPWPPWYDHMVLMFQREVAERIVAAPGSKQYGRLAVLAGWRTQARILFDVAPSAFVPPPKVTSSVVRLTPRATPLPCSGASLARVTAAAFGQRRKMLRASLRSLGGDPQPILDVAGIDPTARAEDIAVEGFVALANALDAARIHEARANLTPPQ